MIRSTASACVPGVGPVCTAIKSVFLIAMDRTAAKNVVAETVEAAITSPANVIAPPVTPDHCEFQILLFVDYRKYRRRLSGILFTLPFENICPPILLYIFQKDPNS